jgi:hypothetical protein
MDRIIFGSNLVNPVNPVHSKPPSAWDYDRLLVNRIGNVVWKFRYTEFTENTDFTEFFMFYSLRFFPCLPREWAA